MFLVQLTAAWLSYFVARLFWKVGVHPIHTELLDQDSCTSDLTVCFKENSTFTMNHSRWPLPLVVSLKEQLLSLRRVSRNGWIRNTMGTPESAPSRIVSSRGYCVLLVSLYCSPIERTCFQASTTPECTPIRSSPGHVLSTV